MTNLKGSEWERFTWKGYISHGCKKSLHESEIDSQGEERDTHEWESDSQEEERDTHEGRVIH